MDDVIWVEKILRGGWGGGQADAGKSDSISLLECRRRVGGAGAVIRQRDCDKERLDQLHQEGLRHVHKCWTRTFVGKFVESNTRTFMIQWLRSFDLLHIVLVDDWLRRLMSAIRYSRGIRSRWDEYRCVGTLEDFLILSQLLQMIQVMWIEGYFSHRYEIWTTRRRSRVNDVTG